MLPVIWFWNILVLNQWLGNITFTSSSTVIKKIFWGALLICSNIALVMRQHIHPFLLCIPDQNRSGRWSRSQLLRWQSGDRKTLWRSHQFTTGHTHTQARTHIGTHTPGGSFKSPINLICMSLEGTRRKPGNSSPLQVGGRGNATF